MSSDRAKKVICPGLSSRSETIAAFMARMSQMLCACRFFLSPLKFAGEGSMKYQWKRSLAESSFVPFVPRGCCWENASSKEESQDSRSPTPTLPRPPVAICPSPHLGKNGALAQPSPCPVVLAVWLFQRPSRRFPQKSNDTEPHSSRSM